MPRALLLTIRLASALALVLVAALYLLASIPFTSYHFLRAFTHFWWIPAFMRFHPLVFAAAVTAEIATLQDLRGSMRRWIRYLAIVGATGAACMAATVWWPILQTYEIAAALCFLPVAILGMTGAIDLAAHRSTVSSAVRRHNNGRVASAAALAGLVSSAAYLLSAALGSGAQAGLHPLEILVGAATSTAGHAVVFVAASLAIVIPRAIAARRNWSPWRECLTIVAGATVVLTVVTRRILLVSLILDERRAMAIAVSLAAALALYWSALVVRLAASSDATEERDVLRLALMPWPRRGTPRWRIITACLFVIATCVAVLPGFLVLVDWGQTLQKFVVCVAWTAAITLIVQVLAGGSRARFLAALVIALAVIGAASALGARRLPENAGAVRRPAGLELAIERYATADTSLSVVLDLVRTVGTDSQFFSDLRRAGDLTDDRTLRPVPLSLVDSPRAGPAHPPNIFFIVIDSLRPDYLSPYNADATFTPAIGAFAADSIVMRHAFTSYAGTALSEAALWAGGLIPRAIYVKPFSPMNNLERLLRLGDYRRYISGDEVLNAILDDWTGVVRTDARSVSSARPDELLGFDLCTTLQELEDRLDRDEAGARPVFFYSQTQSLHIRTLVGNVQYPRYEGLRVGAAEFYKPAATALERLDGCFGAFIDHLKTTGRYTDSIIVLTSDHGDAYGEAGRWGHAFYVAPETMRIPIIIHVPERLRAGRVWRADEVAMSTDITPTLYDLVGYEPLNRSELLGRSMLEPPDGEHGPLDDVFLVQSSYSRVFGLLDGSGRWLYTADVNRHREQLFDLVGGGPFPVTLHAAARLQYRTWLLDRLNRLGRFYRGSPGADGSGSE